MYHILTHPLINNYGGILQAYALQRALLKLNHDSRIVHYIPRCIIDFRKRQGKRTVIKSFISLFRLIANKAESTFPYYFFPWLFARFRFLSIKTVKLRDDRHNLQQIAGAAPFIVGSDQVWRASQAEYQENLPFFFLSFAQPEQRQKSIVYAASFGSDSWEADAQVTQICAALAKEFKAVSVREHSGVKICQDVLGVNAVQMPDPTLLLTKDDYISLINTRKTKSVAKPYVAAYLLDETEKQVLLLSQISKQFNLSIQNLINHAKADKLIDRFPLSIQQWLRFISEAEFLITDSFHGCVFAIIFNIPFVCLGNAERGTARFTSLLRTFGLENRWNNSIDAQSIIEILRQPVNWEYVNSVKIKESERGLQFLKNNI